MLMRFFNPNIQRAVEDFKTHLLESAIESGVTQEQIAGSLGVTQATISGWMDVSNERHIHAALIPFLPNPMNKNAARYIHELANPFKVGKTNGDLKDEAIDITVELGKLAEKIQSGAVKNGELKQCKKVLLHIKEIAERGLADVELMEKR